MTECKKCWEEKKELHYKTDFGFGWVEFDCGHVECFYPTDW